MAVITSNSITFIDNTGTNKYLYIRYSNDGVMFTENNGLTPGEWIGICNSNNTIAPTDFNAYTWSKIKGADGTNGDTLYTWIKYADDTNGTNMSDSPDGKLYLGISYNNISSQESTNPVDYTWSLISNRGIKQIIEYYTARPESEGVTKDSDFNWSTEIPVLSLTNKYLWNYEKTIFTDGDEDETEPMVIGVHGDNGVGIADIVNYYATSQTPEDTPSSWTPEDQGVPALSNTDKYLWNYEKINYTNGDTKTTTAAIIGVYGDEGVSGTDAVDFQIYSVDGFEFSDYLTSIELKTIASKSGSIIGSDATYQWKWWNNESATYENIENAISSTLKVDITDMHAFTGLKCEMTYDDVTYEDYVSLTKKNAVYTSLVNFFSGSNAIGANEEYLVAYVELYKDNQLEETIESNHVCSLVNNSIQNGIVNTDITGEYSDGDMMYFTYQDTDGYNIALCKYEFEHKQWILCENDSKYIYKNDCSLKMMSNVFIVPKDKITRSLNVNIEVCNKDESIISRTNVTVMDLNDPIISVNTPANPKNGQLWLDTSESPSILKMYNGSEWVNSGYQNGGAVYTSKPNKYLAGDLWILAENETCNGFGEGSMLKATHSSSTFDASHWVDAMDGIVAVITNVRESFTWDASGIQIAKRVTDNNGNVTNPFYVHIDSTRMGFHSVEYKNGIAQKDVEVVHIGINSATVQNAIFEGDDGTTFDNNAVFNEQININGVDQNNNSVSFIWKIESNGSLSLALDN